jgi:hypothetical protein
VPASILDRAESRNEIPPKQVCSSIPIETDISNSFALQAMQIVGARVLQIAAKLRGADINHARACRGEAMPFNKQLILFSN